jgi:hypothetical protein
MQLASFMMKLCTALCELGSGAQAGCVWLVLLRMLEAAHCLGVLGSGPCPCPCRYGGMAGVGNGVLAAHVSTE